MTLADLHRPGDPFVLPNAWDVASARALVAAGFAAVGTTSLGVAAAAGVPDATGAAGRAIVELGLRLATAGLGRPVSCDLEDGLSDDPGQVAATVAALGVDGVNLEDCTNGALVDRDLQAAKIRAVKERCPSVFVNARTDVFWLGGHDLEETVGRLRRYVDAGADGVFVPGPLDAATIEAIVAAVPAPLNVLPSAELTRDELAGLGVARISTGSLLFRTALTQAVAAALAVSTGAAAPLAMTYADVEALIPGGHAG